MIITLSKPLTYEDVTYTQIILAFERLTGADSLAVTRKIRQQSPRDPVMNAETDDRYLLGIASLCSGVPEAALLALPMPVFVRIKTEVQSFLLEAAAEAMSTDS